MNYFTDERSHVWDHRIYMRSIPGKIDWMELTRPLPCGEGFIELPFKWNGASVGMLRHVPVFGFPKWKHPIETCKHDFRVAIAKNKEERARADGLFRSGVGVGGTKWEQIKGFIGVRIGAFFKRY